MVDNKNPPFIAPKFDWTKPNLYDQFKIFSRKLKFAFDGQFKDVDNKVKVSCILNWLGNDAFLIYDNLTFEDPAHKDLPDKVLDAFSNYLKPERNVFHSWYMLGSIYSNQFKTQSDFYNHLQCVAKECNFSNSEEVVKFLFLTHNNNTHVCEDLLKEMKEDTSLATMLNIVQISEGTIHSEELSKQYLDTIKVSNKQIGSMCRNPEVNQVVGTGHILLAVVVTVVIVVPNTLQGDAKPLGKSVMVVANLIILSQCADPGIDLSLKAKGTLTLTIHMLPTNLLVVSKIRIRIKVKIDPVNQDNFEFDYEQDSVTMVFNTQFRNRNVMFDEISSQPSLQ